MPSTYKRLGPYVRRLKVKNAGDTCSDLRGVSCIASHDYELAGRLPLQRAREILTELKQQMAGEGKSHG